MVVKVKETSGKNAEGAREVLGTVVSTFEGPSPSTVDFVVNNGKAHKGMFVELEYSEGTMICRINDVIKTNKYFERPDSVKEIGEELERKFPTAEWEFLLGKAKPLGVFKKNSEGKVIVERTTFPPSPGTKVFKADDSRLTEFLGFDNEGLKLGTMQFHNVEVSPNLSRLLQKHLAVLALSGAGKSVFAASLIEELLSRKKEQGQVAVIVFDIHGEYTCFGEPVKDKKYVDFSSKTRIVDASKVKIAASKLDSAFLSMILPKLSTPQRRDLSSIISKLSSEMKSGVGPFDLNTIKTEVMQSDLNEKTASTILATVGELEDLDLFSKIDNPSVLDLVKSGQLTVIDLSGIISQRKKQIIVAYFAHKLFHSRRSKRVPPFSLFLEEAHNFIPEKTGEEHAIAKGILRTIAREGRKFGASLVIISQRPKHLDTTTLANCNTNVILRITNPYDLDHIAQSSEALDKSSMDLVSSLRVGEALLLGEAVNAPTFFRVRNRKSQPSKHEFSLEEAAKMYAASQESAEDEADTFL
ncbi:MAG: ATP-binding protein [Candidatus Diapherotrites archaeon]|nr:ATP-binding protein [Candidatus Diapherotrites archaeon]